MQKVDAADFSSINFEHMSASVSHEELLIALQKLDLQKKILESDLFEERALRSSVELQLQAKIQENQKLIHFHNQEREECSSKYLELQRLLREQKEAMAASSMNSRPKDNAAANEKYELIQNKCLLQQQ